MIKAVLDTNVYLSALFWTGPPNKIVKNGIAKDFHILTSPAILNEVADKLQNKFNVPEHRAALFIDILIAHAELIDVETSVNVVETDPDDNKVVACAIDGNADYIVSGDTDLLDLDSYEDISILSPADFHEQLTA